MSTEKYFFLDQSGNYIFDGKVDMEDFRSLLSTVPELEFTTKKQDVIFKIISPILHIENVCFQWKQMKTPPPILHALSILDTLSNATQPVIP